MKLVICEKNITANRISKILSEGKYENRRYENVPIYEFKINNEKWIVIGLRGHIINLDYPSKYNQWWSISPNKLINIKPCKIVSEKSIAKALKLLVKNNPFLLVATDFDREGELIGVEVINLLKENSKIDIIKRAKFSAITGYEIKKAFEKLSEIDYNLSDAGESRQIIDLTWGAVLTRFISLTTKRQGKDFLSIGRVQSPTLALIVKKEKEIKKFKPKIFWKINATLKKEKSFNATHAEEQFWDEKKVQSIYEKVKDAKLAKVVKVNKKINREAPPPPFNTTNFIQAASYLKLSASRAMSIAEELYMAGLTSYPRTDNTVYPTSLNIDYILEKLKKSPFVKEVDKVINNRRKSPTRGKKKTTDHPPIHPVGVPSIKLNNEQKNVYELICRRFLATLTNDAISETVNATFNINGEEFITSGYSLIEPNWKDIYIYFKEKRKTIPELNKDEEISIKKIIIKEDQTKPPKRYSQGSLISTMEKLLLGTKSTRHEIINKLYQRKYITLSPLAPTPVATALIDALDNYDVVKPKMTAVLEKDMSLISEGKKTLDETVEESKKMLSEVMITLEKDKEKIKTTIIEANIRQNTVGKCPKCNNNMVIRFSKNGKRFVGCLGFPNCKNTYTLPQKGFIKKTDKICDLCKTPVINIMMKGKNAWDTCLDIKCKGRK